MSSRRCPVFAPCCNRKSPPTAKVHTTWEKEAVRLGDLKPGSTGTVACCFDYKHDLSRPHETDDPFNPQLRDIYTTLKPGTLVALKRGWYIIAYVEISPRGYYFTPNEKWGWHSYDFIVKSVPTGKIQVRINRTFCKEGAPAPSTT